MMKKMIVVMMLLMTVPVFGTVYQSSELGWTAGQDITSAFKDLAENTFTDGDKLILEADFGIAADNITLPAFFTLDAVPGAVLTCIDDTTSKYVLHMGSNFVISNITFISTCTFRNRKFFRAASCDDGLIINSRFVTDDGMFIDFFSCHGIIMQNTEFEGGYYQFRSGGNCKGWRLDNVYCHNSHGDTWKTSEGTGGNWNHVITNSFCKDNGRDFLDTTGGFMNGIIRGCTVISCGSAMDFKFAPDDAGDLSGEIGVKNVLIQNCRFYDMNNTIVLTITDAQHRDTGVPLLTAPSPYDAADWCIQDITIRNCSVIKTDSYSGNMLLLYSKQAHTITAENITKIGGIGNDKFGSGNLPGWNLPELEMNYDIFTDSEGPAAGGVNIVYSQEAPPAAPPETVPFLYGPGAGAVPYQFSDSTGTSGIIPMVSTDAAGASLRFGPSRLYSLAGNRMLNTSGMKSGMYLMEREGVLKKVLLSPRH